MEVRVGAVLLDAAAPFDALGDVAGSARYAERAGLDSLWAGDHLLLGETPLLDSTLTLAAATSTIAIGSAVFLPSLRPLAWAGRQVATLAHLASGRLELGVGAGAGPEQEYRAAGQLRGDRGRRTDEFLQALPHLVAGGPVTVGSGDDTITIRLRPAVAMPTVWVGGCSPAALRRTVRFGDGWLGALLSPVEFGRARDRLRDLADAAGRPAPRLGLVTHARDRPRGSPLSRRGRSGGAAPVLRTVAGAGRPVGGGRHSGTSRPPPRGVRRSRCEHVVVINDRTPWQQACDLLRKTRDELAQIPGA